MTQLEARVFEKMRGETRMMRGHGQRKAGLAERLSQDPLQALPETAAGGGSRSAASRPEVAATGLVQGREQTIRHVSRKNAAASPAARVAPGPESKSAATPRGSVANTQTTPRSFTR
ncbi:MAG TPA: hypothetical protein VNK82_08800 [Terriglobales bacterium]|nr:hypothetical protein [Terriglobales bacterium]